MNTANGYIMRSFVGKTRLDLINVVGKLWQTQLLHPHDQTAATSI